MSNIYTLINTTTNETVFTTTSFGKAYQFCLDYYLNEEVLGQPIAVMKNGEEVDKFISARANSGIIHTYGYAKWVKLQEKHDEVLAKREIAKKEQEARKEARKSAKAAMAKKVEKKEVVIEEPKKAKKATKKSTK